MRNILERKQYPRLIWSFVDFKEIIFLRRVHNDVWTLLFLNYKKKKKEKNEKDYMILRTIL
jgi:hypothetical protein